MRARVNNVSHQALRGCIGGLVCIRVAGEPRLSDVTYNHCLFQTRFFPPRSHLPVLEPTHIIHNLEDSIDVCRGKGTSMIERITTRPSATVVTPYLYSRLALPSHYSSLPL